MKKLIVYFSHSGENYSVGVIEKGNTKVIAEYISEITKGDLFEIKPVKKYSENYKTCCNEVKEVMMSDSFPEIKEYLDIAEYDTIYIGYPIWWVTMPREVQTFIKHCDFSGKTIIPFSTHEGSGLGNSINDLKILAPTANILPGLAIQGSTVKNAFSRVEDYIKSIH